MSKTTQILKELGFDNYDGNNWSFKDHGVGISPVKVIEKALAQQQQEDYQEVLDLVEERMIGGMEVLGEDENLETTDIMEKLVIFGKKTRNLLKLDQKAELNKLRKELRQAIAQKRGEE